MPGRSAEDCFNRIYSDLSTPTPIGPRPRTSKTAYSPIGNFTLSDPKLPNILEPTVGRRKTAKQKSLVAQKTVKHLLQKHCRIDQAQEADHFSVFESSPSALQLNLSFEDSHGTPDSYTNSGSLGKCSGSSSARKKPFSRLRTKPSCYGVSWTSGSREENGGRVRMNGGGGLAAPSSSPQARQQECDEQDGWVPKGRISPIPG